MTNESGKIDFEKEVHKIELTCARQDASFFDEEQMYIEWGRSIAARVEEETIRRCQDHNEEYEPVYQTKRLYGGSADVRAEGEHAEDKKEGKNV